MNYVGKWIFDSIGVRDDSFNLVYLSAEEYLKSPIPSYVDEADEEAVAYEMHERKAAISIVLEVRDDGKVYTFAPISEEATPEQIKAAIEAGEITVVDGMIVGGVADWEMRGDEMWLDSGIEGEVFGEAADPWVKVADSDEYIDYINMRFKKAE
ncbi:MAG: hypothetical protein IJA52_00110 [Clostridia bacterium]|nr:hypothetical protein [Clostridia bacterium]